MSEKFLRLLGELRAFITIFLSSLGREKQFVPYITASFERDLIDAAKKHPGLFADFCAFIKTFEPDAPRRGKNIEGTGAHKTEMDKNRRSGSYRIIYYYNPRTRDVVFLMLYPKNVKDNLSSEDARLLKRVVEKIKRGEITLSPLISAA